MIPTQIKKVVACFFFFLCRPYPYRYILDTLDSSSKYSLNIDDAHTIQIYEKIFFALVVTLHSDFRSYHIFSSINNINHGQQRSQKTNLNGTHAETSVLSIKY